MEIFSTKIKIKLSYQQKPNYNKKCKLVDINTGEEIYFNSVRQMGIFLNVEKTRANRLYNKERKFKNYIVRHVD